MRVGEAEQPAAVSSLERPAGRAQRGLGVAPAAVVAPEDRQAKNDQRKTEEDTTEKNQDARNGGEPRPQKEGPQDKKNKPDEGSKPGEGSTFTLFVPLETHLVVGLLFGAAEIDKRYR